MSFYTLKTFDLVPKLLETFNLVPKHTFDLVPKLLETFHLVVQSSAVPPLEMIQKHTRLGKTNTSFMNSFPYLKYTFKTVKF